MCRSACLAGGLLILVGACPPTGAAPIPSEDAKAAVKTFFINLEKGAGDTAPLLAPPAKDVIAELGKYAASGTDKQEEFAVRLIGVIGRLSKDNEARALAVKTLLAYATTEGKPQTRQALERLLEFAKADFPSKAGVEIEKLVRAKDAREEAFLLAGLVEVRSVIEDLKERRKVKDGAAPFSDGTWAAHLALARLGDTDSMKHCAQAIDGEKDLAQRVRHFPELVYVRNNAATELLVRYLMSEDRLPSVKRGDPGFKIAARALHALAVSIEGFPVKADRYGDHTEEQLTTARKWVKEQKELKLKR